jgi:hypothetical protein
VNKIVEELSKDTRWEDEDYDVVASEFNSHFMIFAFNM